MPVRRLLVLAVPLALLLGTYLGAVGSQLVPNKIAPQASSTPAAFQAPAVANDYLSGVLQRSGLANPKFENIGQPIVGSKGSTVYAYRVSAVDADGQPTEAFIGITVYNGEAISALSLSGTKTDLGGMVTVQ
jgi:hypothetical protein